MAAAGIALNVVCMHRSLIPQEPKIYLIAHTCIANDAWRAGRIDCASRFGERGSSGKGRELAARTAGT